MFPPRPTELLHLLLSDFIQAGDLVIDATAGNGYDTVFLAEAVGPEGKVIAIDIQKQAIVATDERLIAGNLRQRVELHQASHVELEKFSPAGFATAIIFNLGYLPGSDHTLITESETTLKALSAAARLLKKPGLLAVVCYPGHEGGDAEAIQVEDFLTKIEGFRLAKYQMLSTKRASPFLLIAFKNPGG